MDKIKNEIEKKLNPLSGYRCPHCGAQNFVEDPTDHAEDCFINGVDRLIEKVYSQGRQEGMLDILAMFDDYSHPLEMTAEYVREQVIEFMGEK